MAKQSKTYISASKMISISTLILVLMLYHINAYNVEEYVYGDGFSINEMTSDYKLRRILSDYITNHPQYKTFIISRPILLECRNISYARNGIMIGPGYPCLYGRRTKMDTLSINGKVIYMYDSISEKDLYYKEGYTEYKRKVRGHQDIYVKEGHVIDNEFYNYLYRALYIDRLGDKIVTKGRLDTIFYIVDRFKDIQIP